MRMVEQFMEILTARLKDERNGLAPLYSAMEELGIPFEIYDDPKQKDHCAFDRSVAIRPNE
jgi:hypothetical protein